MSSVILLGASTRALATSARRAGWAPWCADLFADADLERIATVRKVAAERYPHGLLGALAEAPAGPVIYTGGLENWPGLVARIDRPLWGNSPTVLRTVRSPERWREYLRAYRVPCPSIATTPPQSGQWLLKPRRGSGGSGIRSYAGQPFQARTHFLQEHIYGESRSAVFLGAEHLSALFFGVSRQLIGVPWLHATGYQYCGNIGPLPLDADESARWRYLGAVANGFPLRGLFGIDAVVRDGIPWPVEINPRYTASMELFERSYGKALLPMHRAAFVSAALPVFAMPTAPLVCGKAILYARRTFAVPADGPWLAALEPGVDLDTAEYADIPHAGEVIEEGRPVLTIFASASTAEDCERKLREKAGALDRRLWG
jgi:predicted ATP-grasp superfamily ATP-dependent carboligase